MGLLLVLAHHTLVMAHDFYISITSIQHHPKTERLTASVRLFINDLEESIFQAEGVRLGLVTRAPLVNAKGYLQQYLSDKLFISINGSPVSLNYAGHRVETAEVIEDHVIICQLEASHVSEIVTLKVHNSLLTEAFDSQVNIVNIQANSEKRIINLDRRIPEDELVFR